MASDVKCSGELYRLTFNILQYFNGFGWAIGRASSL